MSEVSGDAVVQAMRTFEFWGGPLRYREEQKWHLRDIMAMRKVLEEFKPDLLAKTDTALAEAEARGRRQGPAWQPIETAPANKAIQVYVPGLDYYGNDGVYAGMLVDMGTGQRWMTFAWALGRDMIGENRPTHWRSLPAPPSLATAPAETPPPLTEWRQTGRGEGGIGYHNHEWFRPSDGARQMYPANFNPNTGCYQNMVIGAQKPETGEAHDVR